MVTIVLKKISGFFLQFSPTIFTGLGIVVFSHLREYFSRQFTSGLNVYAYAGGVDPYKPDQ
jgi:hypothetical protein